MDNFVHESYGQKVFFGRGEAVANMQAAIGRLGASRILLMASERALPVAERIVPSESIVDRWTRVVQHVPRDLSEAVSVRAEMRSADVVVSVGGGSTTGLAKAAALNTGLPVIAVPTTLSGSEATSIWGITTGRMKTTGRDPLALPSAVVYDPALLDSMPRSLAVVSSVNALAHGVDAMWGPTRNPVADALAEAGIRLLADGLTEAGPAGYAVDGALAGVYLASTAFDSSGSGLHHKICHVLGGHFNLPHAETHAAVLPHVLRTNAVASPVAERRLARAFASSSASDGLANIYTTANVPRSLAALGFTESDIDESARLVLEVAPPANPVPITHELVTGILRSALHGA